MEVPLCGAVADEELSKSPNWERKIHQRQARQRANPKMRPSRKARRIEGQDGEPQWMGHPRPKRLVLTLNLRNSTT